MIKLKKEKIESRSKKLRAVLYVAWTSDPELIGFEAYYEREMNRIIMGEQKKLLINNQ